MNYNSITNKPDLSVYATNTNLNNLNNTSTTTFNNVNQLNSIISNSCTIERQYPPKNFDSSTTETTTTFLGLHHILKH